MTSAGYALFDTAMGVCGLAWTTAGVKAVSFPEPDDAAMRGRLARCVPGGDEAEPPSEIAQAITAIRLLLETGRADLTAIALDMEGIDEFERRVLTAARGVPPGKTTTYGALAAIVDAPAAARAVGRAMARNPFPIIVPCHRVLAASGGFGGFSAPGGLKSKARLLTIERAETSDSPLLFSNLPIVAKPAR